MREHEQPPRLPPRLTPDQLRDLAAEHIALFESRLASGSPAVREDECRAYLAIWVSVRDKADVSLLGPEELREVQDALDAGSFDDLLSGDDDTADIS